MIEWNSWTLWSTMGWIRAQEQRTDIYWRHNMCWACWPPPPPPHTSNYCQNSSPILHLAYHCSQQSMWLHLFSRKPVSNSFATPWMDCSLPGSSVQGIFQARILEWVAISFSRGSSPPRDQTQVSCIAGGFFTAEPQGKPYTWLHRY